MAPEHLVARVRLAGLEHRLRLVHRVPRLAGLLLRPRRARLPQAAPLLPGRRPLPPCPRQRRLALPPSFSRRRVRSRSWAR